MEKMELLNKTNLHELEELMENDDMPFDVNQLGAYVDTVGAQGFVYRTQEKPIGFAYGCTLPIPNGSKEFYLHSIDILPDYQGKGHGTQFFNDILRYARENGFSKLFLSSSQSLLGARHIYEKCGGIRECNDEIIFYFPFEKTEAAHG